MLTFGFATNIQQRYPALVYSAPLEKAVDKIKSDIRTLKEIAPETAYIPTLERHVRTLSEALEEASRPGAFLTVEQVARIEDIGVHAVRARITAGKYVGAQKRGGEWQIPKSVIQAG